MKKRFLSLNLAMLMVFSLLNTSDFAVEADIDAGYQVATSTDL